MFEERGIFRSFGFSTPMSARSMAQAQAVFLSQKIELLVCDIEMPQGSGLDLFEWVKSYYPRTECIFVTCHDEYSFLRAAMQLGSCDYILKPVDYAQLNETLGEVVKRLSSQNEVREVRERAVLKPIEAAASSSANPYIVQIISYITEHLIEPIAIADLAEVLHLNAQYVMRLFKKEVGCPIIQYITARRIALSVRYLEETNISVADIAVLCGFDNYSYFIRLFKRFTNETPVSFRKKSKQS
ncbi:MAG: helix-turn-helix domain-containing protein [Clostridia bacterium]|nr:helix-turn-helix domain-containing protein [Clostridia bacterium]